MFTWTEVKYQLLRNRGRMVLLILVAALLLGSMAFYLGNIEANRDALAHLGESIPVQERIANSDASSVTGLNIERKRVDNLAASGVHDARWTMAGTGYLSEEAKQGKIQQGLSGDTQLLGVNCLEAVPALKPEEITYAQGLDGSFLSGEEAICLLDADYAQQNGLELGGEISLPVGVLSNNPDGATVGFIPFWGVDEENPNTMEPSTFRIGGIYPMGRANGANMVIPDGWARKTADANGVEVVYTTFSAELDDPLELNAYKAALPSLSFLTPQRYARDLVSGITVVMDDETFIKTANGYLDNLEAFERFLPAFFVLAIGLATLVIFLVLRSARRDIAIANSLGRTKRQCGAAYLLTILVTDLAGCVIAVPVMVFGAGIGLLPTLVILGIFLLCSALGSVLALTLLLRFDPIDLLTKVD